MGGSTPGAPGVNVLGTNGAIAWSTVNGRVDELDYFIEQVNPDNPNQYLTEEGYRDFEVIEETLADQDQGGDQARKTHRQGIPARSHYLGRDQGGTRQHRHEVGRL